MKMKAVLGMGISVVSCSPELLKSALPAMLLSASPPITHRHLESSDLNHTLAMLARHWKTPCHLLQSWYFNPTEETWRRKKQADREIAWVSQESNPSSWHSQKHLSHEEGWPRLTFPTWA